MQKMRRSNRVLAEKMACDDSVIGVCLPQSMCADVFAEQ